MSFGLFTLSSSLMLVAYHVQLLVPDQLSRVIGPDLQMLVEVFSEGLGPKVR